MLRAQIQTALEAACEASNHTEFVIAGSLSVLGLLEHPPEAMAMSIDIDFYPLRDPQRASLIADELGEGSRFHQRHGYYLDAISPELPTLPDGWQDRMVERTLGSVKAYFLEVHDTAVSKYSRGADNDYRWIEAGIDAGLLDLDTVGARMRRSTYFFDDDEKNRALGGVRLHSAAFRPDRRLSRPLLEAIAPFDPVLNLREVRDNEEHEGPILWEDGTHALQRVGSLAQIVVHRIESWQSKPGEGLHVLVRYNNGEPDWEVTQSRLRILPASPSL